LLEKILFFLFFILLIVFIGLYTVFKLFADERVSSLLGFSDVGSSYYESDQNERAGIEIVRGNTKYTRLEGGGFKVNYDDSICVFDFGFARQGYVPQELINLDDITPLIQSGKYANIYALFNPDTERFADFSAWYLYNKRRGTEDQFKAIHPELVPYFDNFYKSVADSLPQDQIATTSRIN